MVDYEQPSAEPERSQQRETWLRGLYMLIFVVFFAIAETLLHLIALVQFLWMLFAGSPNDAVRRFGVSMALWMADVARFQACHTDEKPFPWKDWPSGR